MTEQTRSGWLEQRLPVIAMFRRHYLRFPMPDNLNALWAFGSFIMVSLGLLVASGVFLALTYTPTVEGAFASVEALEREVASGWFVRGLHMGGVSMMFAALYVHIGRGLWYGSYKAPRELVWLTGLGLMMMAMITAFAGYVLPWGQMSYWGATVAVAALRSIPLIGSSLAHLVLGGDGLGDAALHHFFVLHFVMAFAMLAVVALHVACLHVAGSGNPTGQDRPEGKTLSFHPYYTSTDALGLCLFLMVYAVLVFFLPGMLTSAQNYVMANPLVTPHNIAPEWYFAPFYAILRAVPSRLAGLVLSVGSLGVLLAWPWLDRSRTRAACNRFWMRLALPPLFIAFVILGIAGLEMPTPGWIWVSRLAAAYWYVFFLVLVPVFSYRERRTGA